MINLPDNEINQPSKFRTKNWTDITYKADHQIEFKTTILKSSICDNSGVYIFVKRTATIANSAAEDAEANNTNKKVIFKNCAPFTDFVSEINNR